MSDLGLTSGLGILLIVAMGGLYFVLRMMKRLLMIVLPVIAVLGVLAYQHWGSRDAIDAFKRQQVKAAQVKNFKAEKLNLLLKIFLPQNDFIEK